jgi:AraC family transcriptional regulator, regulatory protein of adaptative response / methylated-DNA-[protein]-cysteine methyltransferase
MMTTMVRDRALSDEQAWAAVLGRDRRLDGWLFYGVASTGVYCRPSCPSRRPRRHNASFFTDPAEAERAGYRPCLRCDPRGQRVETTPVPVGKAREYIDLHFHEPVKLEALGRQVGMSPHHLQRTFKKAYGLTPKEYQDILRLRRLKGELRTGGSVTTAIHEAGYGSASRVYEKSDARLGMPPGAYRRGGRGMVIRFGTVASPLGRLLVAATERGVCAVALGDDDATLEADLRAEYPRAGIERSTDGLAEWLDYFVEYLAGDGELASIPIDVQGTVFQQRVWDALRAIPSGEKRSYAQVAAAIGQPKAARAVARACATNRVALAIPCHRVVREGGGLGGYRWGVDRKYALLAREVRRRKA